MLVHGLTISSIMYLCNVHSIKKLDKCFTNKFYNPLVIFSYIQTLLL